LWNTIQNIIKYDKIQYFIKQIIKYDEYFELLEMKYYLTSSCEQRSQLYSYSPGEKNTLKKYDLQESYNNFKIKFIVSFCESGPGARFTKRYNTFYLKIIVTFL